MAMATDNPKMALGAVLEELEEHRVNGASPPDLSRLTREERTGRQFLPVDAIRMRVAVFQPRSMLGQQAEEHVVLEGLVGALERHEGIPRDMDPVVVWWSGKAFYCVDGHHRLIALQRYNTKLMKDAKANTSDRRRAAQRAIKKVPVTIVAGTLSEALVWTTRENGKVRLSLRKKDCMDEAWKQLVLHLGGIVEGKFVMAKRYRDLHVGLRTLQQMKACFEKKIAPPRDDREAILKLAEGGWSRAQALAEGRQVAPAWDDDRRRQEVEKMAKGLLKAIPKEKFTAGHAELIGEALLMISDTFAANAVGSPEVHDAFRQAVRGSDLGEYPEVELGGEDAEEDDEYL